MPRHLAGELLNLRAEVRRPGLLGERRRRRRPAVLWRVLEGLLRLSVTMGHLFWEDVRVPQGLVKVVSMPYMQEGLLLLQLLPPMHRLEFSTGSGLMLCGGVGILGKVGGAAPPPAALVKRRGLAVSVTGVLRKQRRKSTGATLKCVGRNTYVLNCTRTTRRYS